MTKLYEWEMEKQERLEFKQLYMLCAMYKCLWKSYSEMDDASIAEKSEMEQNTQTRI